MFDELVFLRYSIYFWRGICAYLLLAGIVDIPCQKKKFLAKSFGNFFWRGMFTFGGEPSTSGGESLTFGGECPNFWRGILLLAGKVKFPANCWRG